MTRVNRFSVVMHKTKHTVFDTCCFYCSLLSALQTVLSLMFTVMCVCVCMCTCLAALPTGFKNIGLETQ